jgi:class III poly(R)-hydroxyalkanoic acid synthase PhaE subunit
MTTLIELGAQALQSWFNSGTVNGSVVNGVQSVSTPEVEPVDPFAKGLATSQNLWLQTVKLAMMPFNQAMTVATYGPWAVVGRSSWNYLHNATFGTLARMPLLGQEREFNQKILQAVDALAQLYPAGVAYQGMLMEIQRRSFEAFLNELIALTAMGEPLTDWAELQRIWSRTADQVFEQALCSETSLRTRGDFLNAMNYYKIRQQELMEIYLTLLNLPTRCEVDDIHQTLYELRKEVKHLKKTLTSEAD